MERIERILLEMESECFSGLHYACPCCSDSEGNDGAVRKMHQILPYWDRIMAIIQSSKPRANKDE